MSAMKNQPYDISLQSNRKNLLLLFYLRWVAIFGQIITILIVNFAFDIPLSLSKMGAVIVCLFALNLITYLRYLSNKPIIDIELFSGLILDVAALTIQFYYSGGASNPFIGLFIMQVVIAATILRGLYTWCLVILTLSCYVYLSFFNVEIPHLHHYHIGEFFSLHIHGMLISYALSSVLVAYFVIKMSRNLKERDQTLSKIKERKLAEENILRLGMLAASAAHELGTPLATIAILAGEYKDDANNPEEIKRAEILNTEVMRCKEIISQITNVAGVARADFNKKQALDTFIKDVAERWQKTRTGINFKLEMDSRLPPPMILAEYALEQAIVNILNNAADASLNNVLMQVEWSARSLQISIHDNGKGIRQDIIDGIGISGITTKPDGLGMGLFLTHAIVTRLNGSIELKNKDIGGAVVTIEIPLRSITV